MINLYWKSPDQTRNLVEKTFASEAKLEEYIFENQEILGGDITIIYRQIRTGHKQGIPDMLGVDQDERVCIIELKNVEADESILPQALGYGIWAETNPDSIKAIWLESKRKPEEMEIDWDNMDIRIILVAPSFKSTVPHMAGKIGYDIDLIQVRRYGLEEEEFLLVEVLEPEKPSRVTTTKPRGEWDWEFYESEHGEEATQQFRRAVEALDAFVRRQGWDIKHNLNKYYVGFKLGNRIVFDVTWAGTYAWKLEMKLREETAEGFEGEQWEFQRYDEEFRNAIFRPLQPESPDVTELEGFLIAAYKNIAGLR